VATAADVVGDDALVTGVELAVATAVGVGWVVGVTVAVGVAVGGTAVGEGSDFAAVGLGRILGVGVGAANVAVGMPPSTATARTAALIQIQARIYLKLRWMTSELVVRRTITRGPRSATGGAKFSRPSGLLG
jgi:hypothetical protein